MKPPSQKILFSTACWIVLIALTFMGVSLPVEETALPVAVNAGSANVERALVEGEWMLCIPSPQAQELGSSFADFVR